jgi:hypothetical protein
MDLVMHLFFMSVFFLLFLRSCFRIRPASAELTGFLFPCSMRYSRLLEEGSYANKKADYLWLLITCSIGLLVRSLFLAIPASFCSVIRTFRIVYQLGRVQNYIELLFILLIL